MTGHDRSLIVPKWLLLVHKIPREPTAGRVYVWRKLQQLGALSLQDAVWVLPCTERTREQFQWLAAEITERGGEAFLWEAAQLYATDADSLRRQFAAGVDGEYCELLAALKRRGRDLAALSKRYLQVQARDYFQSELGRKVRERLLALGEKHRP
jgi:hypothetical protein